MRPGEQAQPPAAGRVGIAVLGDPVRIPGTAEDQNEYECGHRARTGGRLVSVAESHAALCSRSVAIFKRRCSMWVALADLPTIVGGVGESAFLEVVDEGGAEQRLRVGVPVTGQFAPESDELVDGGTDGVGRAIERGRLVGVRQMLEQRPEEPDVPTGPGLGERALA